MFSGDVIHVIPGIPRPIRASSRLKVPIFSAPKSHRLTERGCFHHELMIQNGDSGADSGDLNVISSEKIVVVVTFSLLSNDLNLTYESCKLVLKKLYLDFAVCSESSVKTNDATTVAFKIH